MLFDTKSNEFHYFVIASLFLYLILCLYLIHMIYDERKKNIELKTKISLKETTEPDGVNSVNEQDFEKFEELRIEFEKLDSNNSGILDLSEVVNEIDGKNNLEMVKKNFVDRNILDVPLVRREVFYAYDGDLRKIPEVVEIYKQL